MPSLSKTNRSASRMMGVLILLVAALVAAGTFLELLGRRAYDNSQRATDLLLNERIIYSLMVDMETSTRGYIITGDKLFLQPYTESISRLPSLWASLPINIALLDAEDKAGKATLDALVADSLKKAEDWKFNWTDKQIELRSTGHTDEAAANVATGEGKALFDQFRTASSKLNSEFSERVRRYSADLNTIRETELAMLLGLGLLTLASGVIIWQVSRRESHLQDEFARHLDAERKRLQAVIDNLPVGVRLVEIPGSQVILQNQLAEELFPTDRWNNMSRQERIEYFQLSKPNGSLLMPEETPAARVISEGGPVSDIEFIMATEGGKQRHLSASAAPIRSNSGKIISAVIVLQDVTRMKELDQRKDEFIATAAHELRNPLAALSGYNQLIQRLMAKGTASPAMVERNLGEMGKQITRLNNLVERLLDASRIQLGRLILDRSPQDLVKIAQMTVADLETADGGAHNIKLVAPDTLVGCWDAVRLEQVLGNLLGNAIRHTPPGGSIEVRIERLDDAGFARVEIRDEGPGIPPEQRPLLFDRYYQSNAPSSAMTDTGSLSAQTVAATDGETPPRQRLSAKKQGLGLGLYITKEIVKAHKGQIGIEPNPNGGSIFWFTLPLGGC